MKTVKFGPFLGINNRIPRTEMHTDKGDYLFDAINVDIDEAGKIKTRPVPSLIGSLPGAHSLHMISDVAGFVVAGTTLYAITLPTFSATAVTTLTSSDPVSWSDFGDQVLYSNGTDSGKIIDGVRYPWGLPTPSAPSATLGAGSLAAGKYRVAVAYVRDMPYEEGGVSPATSIDVGEGGGIVVTLPGATTGATHVNAYISAPDGEILFRATVETAGTATVTLTAVGIGRESKPRFEAPLPAGALFLHGGALCSFKGGYLFEGLPFRPGYYLPHEGATPFPEDVSNAVSTPNGLYVVADKTYWIPGTRVSRTEETIQQVLPYGGVPGTAFRYPHKALVGWFGEKGIVVADHVGQVQSSMADNVDLETPESGWSAVFEDSGYRRVVSCGYCMTLETKAVTRYENYAITSASKNYGTGAAGIYDLTTEGATPYTVDLGDSCFGSEFEKVMPAAYLGAVSDAPLVLRVRSRGVDYDYAAESYSAELNIQRVQPGRGLRDNWFGLLLKDDRGADFTLTSISFAPMATARRR